MVAFRMSNPQLRHPNSGASGNATGNKRHGSTVLYNNRVVTITETLSEPGQLWVSAEDLTRINGFILKPEGACLNQLCIPIQGDTALIKEASGKQWFNVTAFADKLGQAWVADPETNSFSFGDIPVNRYAMLESAKAPDFELTDRQGKVIRMADYRGKKALIVTWSSW